MLPLHPFEPSTGRPLPALLGRCYRGACVPQLPGGLGARGAGRVVRVVGLRGGFGRVWRFRGS